MGEFQLEMTVARPRSEVFDYLADVRNTPAWYSAVRSARQLDGTAPGPDATYRIARRLPGGATDDLVRTVEFDPPRVFAFGTDAGRTPFRYRYALEGDDHATTIHLDATIEVSGPAALLGPVATLAFKRGMQDNLDTLRRILERP
ncbi:MAG: SRPBCC family protein [Dehalococcoidia bacterium]